MGLEGRVMNAVLGLKEFVCDLIHEQSLALKAKSYERSAGTERVCV